MTKFTNLSVFVREPNNIEGLVAAAIREGSPRLDSAADRSASFIGGGDRVVYPGVPLQMGRVRAKLLHGKGRFSVADLRTDHNLAAEGVAKSWATAAASGRETFDFAYTA